MKKEIRCTAVTVGTTVGIGFLSGLEYEKFVGKNILLFGAVFAVSNFLFSCWASTYKQTNVQDLCRSSFKKFTILFTLLVSLTNLLTLISLLSTTQTLFSRLLPTKLPVWALFVCFGATLMSANSSARNVISYIAVLLSFFAILFVPLFGKSSTSNTDNVSPILTFCYAVFCSTMLLGVTSQIANDNNFKQNATYNLLSAITLSSMMYCTARFGKLSDSLPSMPVWCQSTVYTAYFLSATTSVFANCTTPLSILQDITHDKKLAVYTLFMFCLSMCGFGVDVVMKFSYIGVSVVGTLLITAVLTNLCKRTQKIRKNRVLCLK